MTLIILAVQLSSLAAIRTGHPATCVSTHVARSCITRSRPLSASAEVTATTLSAEHAATLFGRLAESKLYLDPAVGACCHSACSDCEWRDPEGGYRFDTLSATKPKWLACYVLRDFADERGSHEPRWAAAIFGNGEACVSRDEFATALREMDFEMPMGPRGNIKPEQASLADEAVDAFWSYLAGPDELLSRSTMLAKLQEMSSDPNRLGAVGEGPDFVDWKDFARALGAPPFERW